MSSGGCGRAVHVGFVALALSLVDVRVALACEPCSCEKPWGIRPAVDRVGTVPVNARFLIDLADSEPEPGNTPIDASDIHWINDETGAEVPFDVIDATESHLVVWLAPREQLLPNTAYRIVAGAEGSDPVFGQTFRTSTITDVSAPEPELPRMVSDNNSSACGAFLGSTLVWDAIRDNGSSMDYEPVVELRIQSGSQTVVTFADAKNLVPGRGVQLAAPLDDSGRECWGSAGLPFDASDSPLTVTAIVYDRAGNHAELGPIDVALSRQRGGECLSADGDCSIALGVKPGANLDWLISLAAALTLRRCRSHQR
jgi:hypothetical protein